MLRWCVPPRGTPETVETFGTLHLLIGPVGAGKTTYAQRRLSQAPGVFLDVDECMVRLFGEDPRPTEGLVPWYRDRRERCRGLLWDISISTLRCGVDVFLELGLVTAVERHEYYGRASAESLPFVVHLLDAPRDIRRERVEKRNRSSRAFTQIVPLEFFESASDAWEPPRASERETYPIEEA
jgi:predicted kinase